MRLRVATLSLICCLGLAPVAVHAQDPAAVAAAKEKFEPQYAEWKQLIASLREMNARFSVAKPDQRAELRTEFEKMLEQGQEKEKVLLAAAEAYYLADPQNSGDAGKVMAALAQDRVLHDDYETGARLINELLDNKYPEPGLYTLAAIAEAGIGEYDLADKHYKLAEENKANITDDARQLMADLPEQQKLWEKEKQIRATETQADDLPRVLIKTNRGDITIELFENEAPNTVANFINLVEKKFYDGLSFHRVLGGFMMQGGDPKGDGSGGPGYTIDCECVEPNHRNHFRGALSMAHAGPNTGGSQFFITFRPTTHLDGKHTVFGRVIDGMDVLSRIKRRDVRSPEAADTIISMTVIRKRDHDYKPATKPEKG